METLERELAGTAKRGRTRVGVPQVVDQLSQLCSEMSAGDRIPTHSELMQRFQVSERSILSALRVLQDQGSIERVHGSGTYITHNFRSTMKVSPSAPAKSIIALVRPDGSYFDRCIGILNSCCESEGIELAVRPVGKGRDFSEFASLIDRTSACLVFEHELFPLAHMIQERGHRVVCVGVRASEQYFPVPTVYSDHAFGGYLVTKHLIDFGHRHVGFVRYSSDVLYASRRWAGHMRAINEAQREGTTISSTVIDSEMLLRIEGDVKYADELFSGQNAITALIAWNDTEAIRILSILNKVDISVPGRVSLVGYDAAIQGEQSHPQLTTVNTFIENQIRVAVELVLSPVPPPNTYDAVTIPMFVARESTNRPPFTD